MFTNVSTAETKFLLKKSLTWETGIFFLTALLKYKLFCKRIIVNQGGRKRIKIEKSLLLQRKMPKLVYINGPNGRVLFFR